VTTRTSLRVLYAEDNGADADLTKTHFELHAPEIALEIVDTGQQCLVRLEERSYDVLLLDNHFPDMEGIDVLRAHNKTSPPHRRKGIDHMPDGTLDGYGRRAALRSPIRCGTLSNRSCRCQPVDPKADGRAFRIVRV
jgi:CheY-like chemotaxis protein